MEAIVIIVVLAAAAWGLVLLRREGLLGGCVAVVLAGTCLSVPFLRLPLGPVPLTIDRILLLVLVAQFLLWRRWGWAEPKPLGKPEILLGLLTCYMVLSTFRSDWQTQNCQPLSWLILYYLMPFGVYWIVRQSDLSERGIHRLLVVLTVFGLYLAVTSLAEWRQVWWLVFPKYIVASAADPNAEFVGRGRGPLLNPIGNGLLLSVCLGAALIWWPRLGRRGRGLLAVGILVLLGGIYCTLTRSVWMGALLSVAIVMGLSMPRHWRLPVLGGGLLAATMVTLASWESLVSFKRDRNLTAQETANSVHVRPILATIAWQMFLDRPLFGCGYSQYKTEHLDYTSDRSGDLPLEKGRGFIPHNVVFSLLTETGLLGLGMFLALAALWGRDAWRLWSQRSAPFWARQQGLLFLTLLGAYFVNGMFHDISVVPMANMTFFFLAGVTAGLRPVLQPAGGMCSVPSAARVGCASS